MANPKGNPNLKGVKGKSGRKSARVELAKFKVIDKSWRKLLEKIEEADFKDIALPVALKDMTVKTDLTSQGKSIQPILVQFMKECGTEDNTNPTGV